MLRGNQHCSKHCVISRIVLPAACPVNCSPASFGRAKGESKAWRLLLSPADDEFVWVCSFLSSQRSPPRTWKLCNHPFPLPWLKICRLSDSPRLRHLLSLELPAETPAERSPCGGQGRCCPHPTPAHAPSPEWQLWGFIYHRCALHIWH